MKIGHIIFCRYNSNRLPGKVLMPIKGQPVIYHIYSALRQITEHDQIVIATSNEKTDNPIAEFCKKQGINCFRGDLENVAKRLIDCADEYKFDYVSRVCGDNIFIDTKTIQSMCDEIVDSNLDFISNTKSRTFPYGMSFEIVRTSVYKKLYSHFTKPDHYEHVTMYLYENEGVLKSKYFYNTICPEAQGLKFAIDTKEDYELVLDITAHMDKPIFQYGLNEIYELYEKIK